MSRLALPLLLLATVPASALLAMTTPIVGAIVKTIHGTGGVGTEAYTYIGVPLYHPHDYRGELTSTGVSTLTDSTATWAANAYANDYYVEILDGANAGVTATIASNTATQLTTVEDISSFLTGTEAFGIRKYTTLADLFGAENTTGLQGSTSSGSADEILLPDVEQQAFDIYYYKTGGLGGIGWRKAGDAFTEQATLKIPPNQGIIIKRKGASDLELILSGSVLENDSVMPIEQQVNWVNSAFPTDSTLSAIFGAEGGQLIGNTSSGSADQVLIPDGSGGFDIYYYKTGGLGGIGWRKAGDAFTEQASTVISTPGSIIIVKRTQGDAFNLTETKPF